VPAGGRGRTPRYHRRTAYGDRLRVFEQLGRHSLWKLKEKDREFNSATSSPKLRRVSI
jgi:hypothetical protein